MNQSEIIIGLPDYQITGIVREKGQQVISAEYLGEITCPECGATKLRSKGLYTRKVRHENWGVRHTILKLEGRKWLCQECGRYFRQRFPGILVWQRASEAYREGIYRQHLDGINCSQLGRREKIGAATAERYFRHGLAGQFGEWHSRRCPKILGIDEHFFTRKKGFATTLCDLQKHKIYDVVLGRSEASLEAYLQRLEGKEDVKVICMDLSSTYRAVVQKHFPNARIVADRFHVIRLIGQHFLACWRELDPVGSKNRGLLSLMRRHKHNLKPDQWLKLQEYFKKFPAMEAIYDFKQDLTALLLLKKRTRKQCQVLAPLFLQAITDLKLAVFAPLVTLGNTLQSWAGEIATMWRFTRNNGITEGFHNKMELISRQAYGLRNFQNYRMRVKVLCGY